VELDAIGDALQLDVRPFPFQFPVHGELVDERIRLMELVNSALTAKGLVSGNRFTPDLEDLVGLFARGTLAIAAVGSSDGEGLCARAVTDGRFGVLAVENGQSIRFDPVTRASLVRAILGLLPVVRPGPGRSVTVTADEPVSAGRHAPRRSEDEYAERRYLQSGSRPADSGATQRAIAEEIMRRPRIGSGYFTVTARNRNGREGEPLTMNWLDTDAGRYAVLPSTGPDGRLHVTYTPADLARLDQSLSRLVQMMT
jgi:hypothetical protein